MDLAMLVIGIGLPFAFHIKIIFGYESGWSEHFPLTFTVGVLLVNFFPAAHLQKLDVVTDSLANDKLTNHAGVIFVIALLVPRELVWNIEIPAYCHVNGDCDADSFNERTAQCNTNFELLFVFSLYLTNKNIITHI